MWILPSSLSSTNMTGGCRLSRPSRMFNGNSSPYNCMSPLLSAEGWLTSDRLTKMAYMWASLAIATCTSLPSCRRFENSSIESGKQ